jgi:hypothetical protein
MKKHPLIKRLSVAAASALALLASTAPQAQGAAFDSPVGDWDFTLSGNAQGIAQLTFNANGTIDGYVQNYTTKKLPKDNNPRGPSDEGTRGVETTNSTTTITNYFGDATVVGFWSFDERGKILGFLNEMTFIRTPTETNPVTYNITFSGVVTLGTRVTLQGLGPLGKVTYSGIPEGPLVNISGNYSARGKRGSVSTTEFFTLTSQGGNNNRYDVVGASPSFNFVGEALLSGRKQLSMVTGSLGTNTFFLTALVGSIKTNTAKASLKGRENIRGGVSLSTFPTPIP